MIEEEDLIIDRTHKRLLESASSTEPCQSLAGMSIGYLYSTGYSEYEATGQVQVIRISEDWITHVPYSVLASSSHLP